MLRPEDGEDAGHLPHGSDLVPDDFLAGGAGSACKGSPERMNAGMNRGINPGINRVFLALIPQRR